MAKRFALVLAASCALLSQGAEHWEGDLNATGACKGVIASKCKDVEAGGGRLLRCVKKSSVKDKEPLSPSCGNETRFLFMKWSEMRTLAAKVAHAKECKADITANCGEKGSKPRQAWVCLKATSASKLSADCKEKVFEARKWEAEVIELDSTFFEACQKDLETIEECKKLPKFQPLSGRKTCLLKHKTQLTANCSSALFVRMQGDLANVELLPGLHKSCHQELTKNCKDMETGEAQVLMCLYESMNSHKSSDFTMKCKAGLRLMIKEKVSDYRLDAGIRRSCKQDIEDNCAAEKKKVDSLTAAELYGTNWQEGQSGQVIQCLKANFKKLKKERCQTRIKKLVKIHAEAPDTDAVLSRKCKADINTFCNKTEPERIHFCLQNHLSKLSPACKEVEIVQGSIAAMDISMKPQMQTACAQARKTFCSDVKTGDAQIIQCLQDHMDEEELGAKCLDVVSSDLEASNHDWRLKYGVHHACMMDATRLCPPPAGNSTGEVLRCLKTKRANISSTACKAEIFRFMMQGAKNIKFAPHTYAACVEDVAYFCNGTQPGQGRVHECLVAHRTDLSLPCAQTEFEEQQIVAQDIRLHPKAGLLCKSSVKALCPEEAHGGGRIWACLSKHKASAKIQPACKRIVSAHETLQNYAFHLNPQLATHCSKEAARLCPYEAAMSDLKEFGNEGQAISCLIQRRASVQSEACKGVILDKAVQRLANFDATPSAREFCKEDTKQFCGDLPKSSGEGKVHACLRKHLEELSYSCRMVQIELMQLAAEDARLLPFMKKECAVSKAKFCANIPPGEARQILCMLKNLHKPGMVPECAAKLHSLQEMRSKSILFNPKLAKECQSDLELLQLQHGDEVNCVQHEDQDAALTGSAIKCLLQYEKVLMKPGCKSAVLDIKQLQADDLRAVPGMLDACRRDIEMLCPSVEAGAGRWHKCLRAHAARITDDECKTMVKGQTQALENDITLNPAVRRSCVNEIRSFCSEVQRGQARIFVCLSQHKGKDGFSQACKEAIGEVPMNKTVVPPLPTITSVSTNSLVDVLKNRSFWDQWGKVLLGVIAVLLSAWLVAMFYLLRWLRSGRTFYGIHVDTPPEPTAEDKA